MYHKEEEKPK